jgi:hypothetical protein
MARPIEYNEEIITKTKTYIDSCEDEVTQVVSGESDKFTTFKEKIRVKLPSIEGLAYYLKIHKDTIYDWEEKYPQFSDVINDLRAKQADRLINNGLSGDYNAYIAKALLAKHGYVDRQEIKHELPSGILNLDPLDDQTDKGAKENSQP